jgi:hypothetical protein
VIAAHLEADLCELVGIDEETPIKHESRLAHVVVNFLPIKLGELLPLGGNDNSLGFVTSINGGCADLNLLLD